VASPLLSGKFPRNQLSKPVWEVAMTLSIKSLMAVAAMTLGGAALVPSGSAEAQVFYGRPVYQGGYVRYLPGAPAFGPRVGYRPAVAGFYGGPRYGWGGGYRPGGYYGARYGWGGGYRSGY
jgi:hypothetical protein